MYSMTEAFAQVIPDPLSVLIRAAELPGVVGLQSE